MRATDCHGPRRPAGARLSPARFGRMLDAAQYLSDHLHDAPVWIIACLDGVGVWGNNPHWSGSSIYPVFGRRWDQPPERSR